MILVIVLPFLGILIYLIARGGKMQERAAAEADEQQKAVNEYIKQTAGTTDTADQIAKLADLKEKGVISQEEFDAQKAKLLA